MTVCEKVKKWENGGCLGGFVGRPGWVSISMACGAGAWSEGGGGSESGSGGFQMFGPRGGRRDQDDVQRGQINPPADPTATTSAFPTSGGRSLGGSSGGLLSRGSKSPKSPEERAALLERAAERRRQQQQQTSDSVV